MKAHPFVDYYYGPPELKLQAESEPEWSPTDLARLAQQLLEALPAQGFEGPRLHSLIQSFRTPLSQLYAFSYAHGKRLMLPLLQGPDRLQVFRRLQTRPVYPFLLDEWAVT